MRGVPCDLLVSQPEATQELIPRRQESVTVFSGAFGEFARRTVTTHRRAVRAKLGFQGAHTVQVHPCVRLRCATENSQEQRKKRKSTDEQGAPHRGYLRLLCPEAAQAR